MPEMENLFRAANVLEEKVLSYPDDTDGQDEEQNLYAFASMMLGRAIALLGEENRYRQWQRTAGGCDISEADLIIWGSCPDHRVS
jgi:hypothetical protein